MKVRYDSQLFDIRMTMPEVEQDMLLQGKRVPVTRVYNLTGELIYLNGEPDGGGLNSLEKRLELKHRLVENAINSMSQAARAQLTDRPDRRI